MEQILDQLVSVVAEVSPEINLMAVKAKIAGVLSMYDIRPSRIVAGHPDVAQKMKMYLSAKKIEGLSPLTLKSYRIELNIFSKYIQKPVGEITTGDIRTYLAQFDYLKLSSLSTKLSVLKSFFGWLAGEEIITRSPTIKIKSPKEGKRLPKALSPEELEITRESCQTLRQRALVELAYASGCRLSELANLDKKNIDWNNMTVRVIGKGDKERIVPISFKAVYHLKKYLKTRCDILPAIFITERQPYRRMSNRAIQREVAQIGRYAGLSKSLHPHVFRHTLATFLLNNGAELAFVQQLLGHTDPKTTQRYARISMTHILEQYRKCQTL